MSYLNDLKRNAKDFTRATVGQGIGLGWGDEIEALLRETLGHGRYDDLLQEIREANRQYYDAHPTPANVGELAGSFLPFIAAAPTTVAGVGGLAALEAGLYGAGAAENDDERLSEGLISAGIGGTLGAGVGKGLNMWQKRKLRREMARLQQERGDHLPELAGGGLIGKGVKAIKGALSQAGEHATDPSRRKFLKDAATVGAATAVPGVAKFGDDLLEAGLAKVAGKAPRMFTDEMIQGALYDKVVKPLYSDGEADLDRLFQIFDSPDALKAADDPTDPVVNIMARARDTKGVSELSGVPEEELLDYLESKGATYDLYDFISPIMTRENAQAIIEGGRPKDAWRSSALDGFDYKEIARAVLDSYDGDTTDVDQLMRKFHNEVYKRFEEAELGSGLNKLLGDERARQIYGDLRVNDLLGEVYGEAMDYNARSLDDFILDALKERGLPGFADGGLVSDEEDPDGFLRALLGQGLLMGWGDELEAGVRAPFSDKDYDELLAQIRGEYGQYADEHPAAQLGGEFVGGAIPGIAAMFFPGGQPFAAQQLGRSTARILGRSAVEGAIEGAISGAGSADDDRLAGAMAGTVIGGGLGAAIPGAGRAVRGMTRWGAERAFPTTEMVDNRATERLVNSLTGEGLTPQDIADILAEDRAMGVPSILANAARGPADLAEAVAQRAGGSAARMDEALTRQKAGARERVYGHVRQGMGPGDYYNDEERLMEELRGRAKTMYDEAYAVGEIDDPRINQVLQAPQFQAFFKKAQEIADLEAQAAKLRGEDPSKYRLRSVVRQTGEADPAAIQALRDAGFDDDAIRRYTEQLPGEETLVTLPDVRTLDYIKRGIDTVIDRGFDGKGISKPEAAALRALRKEFVNAIDENAPAYKQARAAYAGDMEVLDAMRSGMDEFNAMDHEQVQKLIAGFTPAERDAYRTGVTRNLYSKLMDPSTNFNAAQRIIGSPETQAKLAPLFDSPEEFKLFRTALEREAQLFSQANRILGGSQTARRQQMGQALETDAAMGDMVRDLVTGGWWGSVSNMTNRFLSSAKVPEATADRLAQMLTSQDPDEVAAVVKLMEDYLAKAGPAAIQLGAAESGVRSGAITSLWLAPEAEREDQP